MILFVAFFMRYNLTRSRVSQIIFGLKFQRYLSKNKSKKLDLLSIKLRLLLSSVFKSPFSSIYVRFKLRINFLTMLVLRINWTSISAGRKIYDQTIFRGMIRKYIALKVKFPCKPLHRDISSLADSRCRCIHIHIR